jgi:MoxR-like ATPase
MVVNAEGHIQHQYTPIDFYVDKANDTVAFYNGHLGGTPAASMMTLSELQVRGSAEPPGSFWHTVATGVPVVIGSGAAKSVVTDEVVELLDLWDLYDALLEAGCPRMLNYGPPGTGKSYNACAWAAKRGFEALTVTLTEQTPMSELRGHFILKGSEYAWHDGIVSRAWRLSQTGVGVVLVFNEINEAGPDVETFLHNALDDPEFARIDLPTGDTLRPAKGKIVKIATMNGEPNTLREALRDRFPVKLNIMDVHPQALAALPDDVRALASHMTKQTGAKRLSIRPFVAFAELRERMPALHAAQAVFGEAAHDIVAALAMGASADRR